MNATATGGRVWAAAILGVPSDVSTEASRSAFLRALDAERQLPPEERVAAVNVLTGAKLPVSSEEPRGADPQLHAEIVEFEREFWSSPPDYRRGRWSQLYRECRDRKNARSAARLKRLEPALDLAAWPHPDPAAEELAELIRELFLLPPRERALRRANWLREHAAQFPQWMVSSRAILRDAMPLAWLEPRLFEWFAGGAPPQLVDASRVERPPREAEAEFEPRPTRRSASGTASASASKFGCGGVTMVIFVAFTVIRIIISGLSTDKTPQPQNNSVPFTAPSNPSPLRQYYTPERLAAFEAYEKNSLLPEPSGYTLFKIQSGKVKAYLQGGNVRIEPEIGPRGPLPTRRSAP